MTEAQLIHQGWADWQESFHMILLEDPPIWNDTKRPLTAQERKGVIWPKAYCYHRYAVAEMHH